MKKSRGDRARELFREGYNCSQAVTLAFAEELEARGISREMAAGLASSFGGGLGRLRGGCGCVSGVPPVCRALEGYTDPKAAAAKQDHYKKIQELVTTFKNENGSYICLELLAGINTDTNPVPEARTESQPDKAPVCRARSLCSGYSGETSEREPEIIKSTSRAAVPLAAAVRAKN